MMILRREKQAFLQGLLLTQITLTLQKQVTPSMINKIVWTPQREFQRLHGKFSERLRDNSFFHMQYMPPVRAELIRSVSAFERIESIEEGRSILRDMLNPLFDSRRIIVMNNRIFVRKNFFAAEADNRHIEMLASMTKLVKIPNYVALFSSDAQGHCYNLNDRFLPTMVVSKIKGYQQPGILVPNQHAGNLHNWSKVCREYEAMRRQSNWNNRTNKVLWRGKIEFTGKCIKDTGNFNRLAMASLTMSHSDKFDIKCQGRCNMAALHHCNEFNRYHHILRKLNSSTDNMISKKHLAHKAYARWKYILNFPGLAKGSYSRSLNHFWFMGSIVLLYDSPHVEWYYAALRQGKTHLTVNENNAHSVLALVDKDPTLQQLLIENALHVSSQLICSHCLARYMLDTIQAVRNQFRFDLTLDNTTIAHSTLI
uniref:Glycosyl transferase CAP10 domain-containing protein n=1 Tax=Aureoumbra lagunensis TaxID=44058 RepID=A0A7S3K1V1_9STRA